MQEPLAILTILHSDVLTDTASSRVACPRLKTCLNFKIQWNNMIQHIISIAFFIVLKITTN